MAFKKGQKPPKKGQKMSELETKIEENAVDTVVENEINNEIEAELENVKAEAENEQTVKATDVVGTVGGTNVHMQARGIRFQKFDAPVPMFMIQDEELRSYLVTKGFGTNVYQKSKEWLESHGADMKMIERLKKYVTGC